MPERTTLSVEERIERLEQDVADIHQLVKQLVTNHKIAVAALAAGLEVA